jgi:hypothetical protein
MRSGRAPARAIEEFAVMNAYKQKLERDLANLRYFRVQLRKQIEWLKVHTWQDATETARSPLS